MAMLAPAFPLQAVIPVEGIRSLGNVLGFTGIHISFGSLSCHFSLMAPADGCSSNYGSPIHFDAFKSCRVVEARKTDLYADLACEKYPLQAWGFEQNARSYGIYLGPLNCNIRWKSHF